MQTLFQLTHVGFLYLISFLLFAPWCTLYNLFIQQSSVLILFLQKITESIKWEKMEKRTLVKSQFLTGKPSLTNQPCNQSNLFSFSKTTDGHVMSLCEVRWNFNNSYCYCAIFSITSSKCGFSRMLATATIIQYCR